MTSSPLFLGLDGGGTKTKAVLIDEKRKVFGNGFSGGSNANILGFKKAIDNLKIAVNQSLRNHIISDVASICFAIAGINTANDKSAWEKEIKKDQTLSKIPKLILINDSLAALRAGTNDKNAIVIIAGTGSNCYGRNENGHEARSGGLDWILSDEGSAYAIGLEILHRTVQALDGRGTKTILTNLLFEKLKIKNLDQLHQMVYQKPWNKSDIASIAPLAQIAADKGDQIAKSIVIKTASDLAEMVKAVATKLNLKENTYPIVYTGSVFKVQKTLFKEFQDQVRKFSPKAKFVEPKVDSATGAAYLAMKN